MSRAAAALFLSLPLSLSSGCSGDDSSPSANAGASTTLPASAPPTGPPTAPPTAPPGSVLFAASGEVLALSGYPFPPKSADDPAFVDGWEVTFTRLLTTIDRLTLSENPDKAKGDQSLTDGVVAEIDGPFAVDLQKGGPLLGKGGTDERAVPLAVVTNQNRNGGAAFDPTRRYAFGFDAVPASASAHRVNLDADGLADYAEMIAKGWVVLYVGTAIFKGTGCTTNDDSYDFTKLPAVVSFRFGFSSPTSYVNCQNPDNDPAAPFADEEHQRGVQVLSNTYVTAQVTFHTDHPFWESVAHDSPAHFDPLAAHFVGNDAGAPTATLDDYAGVDFTAFVDGANRALPWRSCVKSYAIPAGAIVSYDSKGVAVNPAGDPARVLRDFRDYLTYNQSTQGHLNSDGLCYVKRNYPSPP